MGIFDKLFSGERAQRHAPKPAHNPSFWNILQHAGQLDSIVEHSMDTPCLLFKHSTRCSTSSMVLSRLERDWNFTPTEIQAWYLDLIAFRETSNAIAARFGVEHQSPQSILLWKGKVIHHASHSAVSIQSLREALLQSKNSAGSSSES